MKIAPTLTTIRHKNLIISHPTVEAKHATLHTQRGQEKFMATVLTVRPIAGSSRPRAPHSGRPGPLAPRGVGYTHRMQSLPLQAGSRADDSAPYEMSLENALKLLGVSEGASFDDILRAKNSIIASCKDDEQAIARVEAAYDMLLMQNLSQRRAGKVIDSKVRYADVKSLNTSKTSSMPKWFQTSINNSPISIETPSTSKLGVQAGLYGALMVLTYVNGASVSSNASVAGADVPGLILATSFGASLYFMTKKNVKLGKATIITIGGLVAGAVVGSAVESWLQVDIVPLMGIRNPATVVSEFVLFSQFLVSLYLR